MSSREKADCNTFVPFIIFNKTCPITKNTKNGFFFWYRKYQNKKSIFGVFTELKLREKLVLTRPPKTAFFFWYRKYQKKKSIFGRRSHVFPKSILIDRSKLYNKGAGRAPTFGLRSKLSYYSSGFLTSALRLRFFTYDFVYSLIFCFF